ncbi:MAG: GNAT family N-acetyltransferase [Anaerolineae bacterium]|nr:GNAT family N-acetyltransferase [Anaerolineae bacterium]
MTDMLVKLYALPPLEPLLQQQRDQGITIRRALAPEKHHILHWVRQQFSEFWVSECDVAINSKPVSCWIATFEDALIGFGCYDTTCKGFFGPTGVSESARGRGTGTALLLVCLHDMRSQGYGYAIIGHVGPTSFYERAVGATIIPDSSPSVYAGLLRK